MSGLPSAMRGRDSVGRHGCIRSADLSRWTGEARAGNGQHRGVRCGRTRDDTDVARHDGPGRQSEPVRRRHRPRRPREAPRTDPGATARPRRAGHRGRRVQAGQEQAHQRPRQRARRAPSTTTSPRACRPRSATPRSRPRGSSCATRMRPRPPGTPSSGGRSPLERTLGLRVGAGQPRQRAPHRLGRGAASPRDPQGRTQARRLARVSEGSTRRTPSRPSRRSRRLTPCCSCRMPRRSTPSPRCSSSSTRCASRPTSPPCSPRPTSTRSGARSSSIDRGHLLRCRRCAHVLGLQRPAPAGRRAAGPRAQRRVGVPRARRASAARGARPRGADPRAQRRARSRLGRRAADGVAALRAQRDPAPGGHPAHDRPARGGEGAGRRVPRPLRALAGDPDRRHRRPHRRHGARPARPSAQGAARGGDLRSTRATPGPIWDQITEWLDQRVAGAVSETFVWTDERSRWLSEEVAAAVQRGRVRPPGHRRGRHPGRDGPRRAHLRTSTPGGWARARRSTSACADRTAGSSWWVWPPA